MDADDLKTIEIAARNANQHIAGIFSRADFAMSYLIALELLHRYHIWLNTD